MDPETYENAFKSLDCAEQTRVQYLDSRDEKPNDQFLDDETLLEKLPAIVGRFYEMVSIANVILDKSC